MELKKNLALSVRDEKLKGRIIARLISNYSHWLGGFYTEELRSGGSREGFMLRTLSGESEVLASRTLLSPVAFNKYGVNARALDGLAALSLEAARDGRKIALMDELGPITLSSGKLAESVLDALASGTPCLATFRRNASDFERTFFRMDNTLVIEAEEEALPELQSRLDGWMEFWINRLRDKAR
ncbi:MAG TPA: nucleoside-triphosphatase [Elusimicrobiales bacterium]|nr:nucleoside-triphosphatase [Elusimicrobiales bacterium]